MIELTFDEVKRLQKISKQLTNNSGDCYFYSNRMVLKCPSSIIEINSISPAKKSNLINYKTIKISIELLINILKIAQSKKNISISLSENNMNLIIISGKKELKTSNFSFELSEILKDKFDVYKNENASYQSIDLNLNCAEIHSGNISSNSIIESINGIFVDKDFVISTNDSCLLYTKISNDKLNSVLFIPRTVFVLVPSLLNNSIKFLVNNGTIYIKFNSSGSDDFIILNEEKFKANNKIYSKSIKLFDAIQNINSSLTFNVSELLESLTVSDIKSFASGEYDININLTNKELEFSFSENSLALKVNIVLEKLDNVDKFSCIINSFELSKLISNLQNYQSCSICSNDKFLIAKYGDNTQIILKK